MQEVLRWRSRIPWQPSIRDLAEILLLASALPLYYLVRGQAHERVQEAIGRGIDVVRLEQSLGIFWEVELQSWALQYDWLVQFLNGFYLYGHLPIIGVLAVWMYLWHRPQYLLMRNAFLLSGAIGLVIFITLPTAPPRLLPEYLGFGFVDTVVEQTGQDRPLTPNFFVNQYAAMPSLHLGWNMLVGIAVWLATANIFMRAFAVLMPAAMFADIVLTANHYILDGFADLAVMLVGLVIAIAARWAVRRYLWEKEAHRRARIWPG
jgi:hypothetical protein